MKKRVIICITIICIMTCGCGKISPQEEIQQKMEVTFSNIDLLNASRIDFISYPINKETNEKERMRFSCLCKHKDIDTIFCRKYDYYESVYRMYLNVSELEDKYKLCEVSLTESEITDNERSHYLQVTLDEPITVNLAGTEQTNVEKLLYDAESGALWLANTDKSYTVFAEMEKGTNTFKEDGEILNYIEGKWEHPPYDTLVEAIQYSLTGIDLSE